MNPVLVAILLGILQGVLEWIPVSSEGGVALASTVLGGFAPDDATRLALFLHAGTGVSAIAYYRADVVDILSSAREITRRPCADETADTAGCNITEEFATPGWRISLRTYSRQYDLSFLAIATAATGLTGLPSYLLLDAAVSGLEGGLFLALIGGLLVLTGLLQRSAVVLSLGARSRPDWVDAVFVGSLQGVAVLPGVSRSGTTVSALLLRGHKGESALRLSFLLSVPAALGANALVLADDGVPTIDPLSGLIALAVSAAVGYLTVDVLVKLVRRVPVWIVCLVFGGLGVAGGLLVAL